MHALTGCADGTVTGNGVLHSPERNRYYYGKLLDAHHFRLEQEYGNGKRWLLNRLAIGTGVLCGLHVEPADDRTRVRIAPGVALDGLGREIIVPAFSAPVDPRQPTDECGRATDEPLLRGGIGAIYICYHECPSDPAPVMVPACETEERCEYGLVRERYRVQVRAGAAPPTPGLIPDRVCARIFGLRPATSLERLELARSSLVAGNRAAFLEAVNSLRLRRGEDPIDDPGDEAGRERAFEIERRFTLRTARRRALLCELFGRCEPTGDVCVPLAIVRFDQRGRIVTIDNCSVRRPLFSNAFLLDLILCLGERVDACCDEPEVLSLSIASGDNQLGVAGELLAEPLVARVADSDGTPQGNETVVFEAVGDSAIGDDPAALGATFTTQSAADGTATLAAWRLGQAQGLHVVTARIAAGMPHMVTFRATATRVRQTPPVVRAVWPPSAAVLARGGGLAGEWHDHFFKLPRIQVTFDRRMSEAQLDDPDPWLAFYVLVQRSEDATAAVRMPLARQVPPGQPLLEEPGVTETYLIRQQGTPDITAATTLMRAVMRQPLAVDDAFVRDPAAAGGAANDNAANAAPGGAGAGAAAVADIGGFAMVRPVRQIRGLITIRAAGGNIVAADPPTELLDADFAGTALTQAVLDDLGTLAPGATTSLPAEVWDAFVPVTGAVLPQSGDGTGGGTFHSWFAIVQGR